MVKNNSKKMKLSETAINDLKIALIEVYGTDFSLTNEALEEIGLFLLTTLAEVLKHRKRGKIRL